ncbi:hypothetical protein [Priestia flexa]|uniref:hypothetical protein n=1 Tax=Priestia flexa TaxID=86664 RepID=UPI00195BFB24
MEYTLQSIDSAIPCEVTIDDDNGRYMLRNADASGEVFNSASELTQWVQQHWNEQQFVNPEEFRQLVHHLQEFIEQKKRLGHNKMIASKRRTIAVPIFLVCLNTFVPLRYGHSLSAGRNLSFLAALRDLRFPSLSRRSRVSYAPFHPVSNIVFTINKKPERLKVRNSQSFRFIIG